MKYWADRQKQLYKSLAESESQLKKRLSAYYDAESKRLEKEIASYYQQYGKDNVIAYKELMKDLDSNDKRLLMQDLDAFVKKYPEHADLMPVRESVYKLNRLQGLQLSITIQQGDIAGNVEKMLQEHFEGIAVMGAQSSIEALGKNAFVSLNPNIAKTFVNVPWANGATFSDTIWGNTEKLINYINTDLSQGFARGDSYERLAKEITERFDKVSRRDAYRLIYTEGTYVMAESSIRPLEDDFEYYKISTVGDNKVCRICKGIAKTSAEVPLKISERVAGENFPPFHPYCRCTFEIVVADWDKWIDDYAARDNETQSSSTQQNIGLDKSFTINSQAFDDYLLENHSEVYGNVADMKAAIKAEYEKKYNTELWVYRQSLLNGEEAGIDIVSMEQYHKNGLTVNGRTQLPDYVSYEAWMFKNRHYAFAQEGTLYRDIIRWDGGATELGYGKGKGARLAFDARTGLSKFIDNNKDIQYNGGTVYRGIMTSKAGIKELEKAFGLGTPITMRGPSSWSTKRAIAEEFAEYSLRKNTVKCIFIEEGEHLRKAMPYPYSSTMHSGIMQNEVVYSGNAKFGIVDMEDVNGVYYVKVKEL